MTYYALLHVPTGRIMPQQPPGQKGGWSYWEPTHWSPRFGQCNPPPRLFETIKGAKLAAYYWVQRGAQAMTQEEWADQRVYCTPAREPDDIEIVEVTLDVRPIEQ
jgi:hypothetical protein